MMYIEGEDNAKAMTLSMFIGAREVDEWSLQRNLVESEAHLTHKQ
jgi:hypothetical protein